MAYQTGVTSSRNDLISTLVTFLGANGFEVGPQWGVGSDNYYSVKKGNVYFNIQVPIAQDGYIYLNTGLSAGEFNLTGQVAPGPVSCRVDNLGGPHVGYHFFTDGFGVNVAVEVVTNVFVHFNFGVLQKNGDFDGGEYVTGTTVGSYTSGWASMLSTYNITAFDTIDVGSSATSYNGGHVRTPISGPAVRLGRTGSDGVAWSTGLAGNAGRPLVQASPNAFNGRSVLVPINIVQSSSGTSGPYYQLGTVGNARFLNIANLNPKEMVNTDWMVFPLSQKNGPGTTYINSANYGIAYRL